MVDQSGTKKNNPPCSPSRLYYLRRKHFILFFYLFFLAANSIAQIKWKQVADDSLPAGVKLFTTSETLKGRPFKAYYLEANLKNRKLEFTTQVGNGSRFTPTQYYEKEGKPLVVVNCTFFSFATNQNLNVVMKDEKLLAYNVSALKSRSSDSFYYPTRSAIGIKKNRKADVAWIFTDSAKRWPYAFQLRPIVAKGKTSDPSFKDLNTIDSWKWWKVKTAVGGGPVLIQEGRIQITNKEEQMFADGIADLHPRTAMGYTKNKKLIILVVQGRSPGVSEGATLEEEAKILLDLGCYEALNLDGGGSSCLLVNGKETIRPSDKEGQRPVPAVFIIRRR